MLPSSAEKVKINVRGKIFETYAANLHLIEDGLLHHLDNESPFWNDEGKEYFFDRDPEVFNSVLNFYTTQELHLPKNICPNIFRSELKFWGIPPSCIQQCCWRHFYEVDEHARIAKDLDYIEICDLGDYRELSCSERPQNRRQILWTTLVDPHYSPIAWTWNIFYLVAVVLSILCFFLGTLDEFRTELYLSSPRENYTDDASGKSSNFKLHLLYTKDVVVPLFIIETTCLVIFSTEFFLKVFSCPDKKAYLKNSLTILHEIPIMFMWVDFIFDFFKTKFFHSQTLTEFYVAVKTLTMLRALLLLRLQRQMSAFRVLLYAIRTSLKELFLVWLSFFVACIVFACAAYYAELFIDSKFDNLFYAVWWSIVTMSTIGYGDVIPSTPLGYVIGVICALFGIIILALPVAVVASVYSEYYRLNRDQRRHFQNIKEQRKMYFFDYSFEIRTRRENLQSAKRQTIPSTIFMQNQPQ